MFCVICIGVVAFSFVSFWCAMSLGVSTMLALLTACGLFWRDTNRAASREGSKFYLSREVETLGDFRIIFSMTSAITNQRDIFKFRKVSLYIKSKEIL